MDDSIAVFYETQSVEQYERSHAERFDFLVKDLELSDIENSVVGDIGAGYGPVFQRMSADKGNRFVGFDGAQVKTNFEHVTADLSYDKFGESFIKGERLLDYAFCFETLEHLTNPYHCLMQIKKMLKPHGALYLSVPHESVTHNTVYPGLLYPIAHFDEFLRQMAFGIERHVIHDKSFVQHVYTLRNLPWGDCLMKWPKGDFKGQPPHVLVNL